MTDKYDEKWARQLLKQQGIRQTEARIRILEILAAAPKPLEAQEICAAANAEKEWLWLSTVYRNLEVFVQKGLVQESNLPDSEAVFYRLELHGHNHYAFCERCHKEFPLDLCPIVDLEDQLKEQGFTPTHHRLEIYGLCAECKKKLRHLRENKREK